ncbi:30S ribosomal protein S25e [compost metagenome]
MSKAGDRYTVTDVLLPEGLLAKARRELARGRFHTPYRVAQRYGVTISVAKKILNILEKEGILVRYSGTRRSPIYVPRDRLPAFKTIGVGVGPSR